MYHTDPVYAIKRYKAWCTHERIGERKSETETSEALIVAIGRKIEGKHGEKWRREEAGLKVGAASENYLPDETYMLKAEDHWERTSYILSEMPKARSGLSAEARDRKVSFRFPCCTLRRSTRW